MATQDVITLIRDVYDTGRASPTRCEQLSQLQKSEEAWSVCSDILKSSPPNASTSCIVTFAAVTLKRKVKRDLHILPANTHEPLRCLIVESLVKFAHSKPICTQLCIALVYLILQSDQWTDPIVTVTTSLPDNQFKATIMLEYFTILAEELNGLKDVKIGRNRRGLLRKQLEAVASNVNEFLLYTVWQTDDSNEEGLRTIRNVIACFTVWIDGCLLDERILLLSGEVPILSVLFKYLLDGNCDEDLHDACTECLCTMLQVSGENVGTWHNLLSKLNTAVLDRIPTQLGPVETWSDDVGRHVFNLLKVLVGLGYSLLNVFRLNIPDDGVNDTRILTCLLEYSKCTDSEVADIMLSFWAELNDCLLDRSDKNLDRFYPIVCKVVDILLQQVRLPSNITAAPGQNSELFRLRRYCQNIMHSTVCLLGLDQCCKRLCSELSTEDWIKAEAAITLLWACGTRLSELEKSSGQPIENNEIQQVLEGFVFQMQPNQCHPALAATFVDLLNSLSQWLARRNDLLVKTMDFLFKLLPDTAQSACAKAILSLCLANPYPLIGSLSIFVDAAVSALRARNVAISQSTVLSLVKATAHLIMCAGREGKIPPLDTLMAAFNEDLQLSMQNTGHLNKRMHNKEIISRLDRICAFFRVCNQGKQPEKDNATIQLILQSMHSCLWPHLTSCLMHDYVDIVEAACNIFRYAIRLSGPAFEPLAESMIDAILKSFQLTRNSCMLYLASVLLDELGNQPCPWLERLVNGTLISEVLSFLSTSEDFRKNPDMADDFFRLCKRLVQRRPQLFLSDSQGKRAFDLAVENCVFEHPDALPSLLDFLAAVCSAERHIKEKQYFSDMNILKMVVSKMLVAVAHDDLLESTRISYAEFLCSLEEELDRDVLIKAIENSLVELPRNRGSLGLLVDDDQLSDLVVRLRKSRGIESLKSFLSNLAELFL